jgi:TetR/AcrR family transcriptional regulator, transcriptional repressor for nem operon
MRTKSSDIRARLIHAGANVVHRQGYHRTTLADIAREARFPLGNLYYHFKTKEGLCEAILDRYRTQLHARFAEWDQLADPRARLDAFVEMIVGMRQIAAQSGCPFGTLASELSKERASLAEGAAALFHDAMEWIAAQFRAMGKGKTAKALAAHVVAVWQGSLFLAHTFGEPHHASAEANQLKDWIREQT